MANPRYLISRLHPPRTGWRDLPRTPSGVTRQEGLPGAEASHAGKEGNHPGRGNSVCDGPEASVACEKH